VAVLLELPGTNEIKA